VLFEAVLGGDALLVTVLKVDERVVVAAVIGAPGKST
jgi:hypothetical protein